MEQLKPCPFCGGNAILCINTNKITEESVFYVYCKKCLSRTGRWHCRENAINIWNVRENHEMDKIEEQLEAERSKAIIRLNEDKGTAYEFSKRCTLDAYEKAIKIVKGGGVDEC